MSHLDTEYDFQTNECVMVYGKNLTDIGTDSCGSGKSILLESVCLGITGEVSRKTKKESFINDNEEETYIQLDLKNNVSDIKELSIRRWFHRKKSSKIELWENGEKNKQMTSVGECNKRIFELIGISIKDFLHFFSIGQDSDYSFLVSGDTDMKSIISRFAKTDFINDKIEELKGLKKDDEKKLDDIDSEIEKYENNIEFINEEIEEEENDAAESNLDKIKTYNDQNLKYVSKKEGLESGVSKLNDQKDVLSKKVKKQKGKIEDTTDLYSKLRRKKKEISIAKKRKSEIDHDKNHLEALQEGELSCPKCEEKFILDSEISLDEIPELISAIDVLIEEEETIISDLEKESEKIKVKIDKSDEYEEEYLISKRKFSKLSNTIKLKDDEIEALEENIIKNKALILEIKESAGNDTKINSLKAKKKEAQEKSKVLLKERGSLSDSVDEKSFWIHHFGKKGFLTFLTNKSIKAIEGVTNSHLKKVNTDLQIRIDGFTVLKSGDVREKIDVSVIRNGKELGILHKFSGGEKGKINLANVVGMQKLFNLSAPNGGLNFLGLDERFEGLDITGQRDFIKILESLNITTMVVSHRSEPIGSKNELTIEKVEGVSYLIK